MSDITLSSAVRDNLLSLQTTASMMADTQFKLSTGLDVNSALDDPNAYFTSESLSNRASDLNTQLDSIDNGVRTLQAAEEGISSLSSLVNQLKSTANSALNTKIDESDVTGSVEDLDGSGTALAELGVASTTTIDITHGGSTTSIELSNQTVDELASTIGNISGITAQVNSDGAIEIAAADGRELVVAGAAATAAGIDGTVEGTNRDSYVNDFIDLKSTNWQATPPTTVLTC
jgi:flagellin